MADSRQEIRDQRERVAGVLRDASGLLGVEQPKKWPIRVELGGIPLHVRYVSSAGEASLPIAKQYYAVHARHRWNEGRVKVNRKRTFERERDLARLERRISSLSERRRSLVVEALTEIPGRFFLTRSRMSTQLGPDASAADLVGRVETMAGLLQRLEAAPS